MSVAGSSCGDQIPISVWYSRYSSCRSGAGILAEVTALAAIQPRPAREMAFPQLGNLAEHCDARTHVFAALRVVRRRREHRVRPQSGALRIRLVQRRRRHAVPAGIVADLVQTDQPVVAIHRRVLDAFRGDRRSDLLELHRELQHRAPHGIRTAFAALAEQHVAQEVEHAQLGAGAALARDVHGPVHDAPVLVADAAMRDIRAIDREARNHFANGLANRRAREIGRAPVQLRDAIQLRREHFDLGSERRAHHQPLAVVRDLLERRVGLGELSIAARHPHFVLVADQPAGRQGRRTRSRSCRCTGHVSGRRSCGARIFSTTTYSGFHCRRSR